MTSHPVSHIYLVAKTEEAFRLVVNMVSWSPHNPLPVLTHTRVH